MRVHRINLPYSAQRDRLEPGDVLLWTGSGFVSRFIMWRTEGDFSHASLVDVDRGRVWTFESHLQSGVRHVPLSNLIRHGAEVAWFTHVSPHGQNGKLDSTGHATYDIRPLDRDALVQWVIDRVADPYDGGAIVRFLRLLWPWTRFRLTRDDDAELPRRAICSALVSGAVRAGGRDLVPNLEDRMTSPADLERSALLRYMGHLVWDGD